MGRYLIRRRQTDLFDPTPSHEQIWAHLSPEQQQQALQRFSALLVDIIPSFLTQPFQEKDHARNHYAPASE